MKKRFFSIVLSLVMALSTMINAYAAFDYGDVTADSILTAEDSALILQKVMNSESSLPVEALDNEWNKIADVSGDGNLTAEDAAFVLQKVLDDTFKFPVDNSGEETETTTAAPVETTEATTVITTEVTTEITTEIPGEETTASSKYLKFGGTAVVLASEANQKYPAGLVADDYLGSGIYIVNGGSAFAAKYNAYSFADGSSYSEEFQVGKGNSTLAMDLPVGYVFSEKEIFEKAIVFASAGEGNVKLYTGIGSSSVESAQLYLVNADTKTLVQITSVSKDADGVLSVPEFNIPAEGIYYILNPEKGSSLNVAAIAINVSGTSQTTESTSETTTISTSTESTTKAVEQSTETTTYGEGVTVTDFSGLKAAISGGESVIYIKGTIDCTEQISLSKANANMSFVGVDNADGTAATLDFASFRDSVTKTGESGTGFLVKGSYYNFENLIIQNAPDCGIRIKGSGAGHCILKNCTFRYNNNSGTSVTSGGAYNTFICVDSYRNGDIINKCGDDADGFSIKLGAGKGNTYYNCRAWENSDDGWDSYTAEVPEVFYDECLAWNNGNPYVFTGEYDYENGFPLDKNLLYVQQILREYPDFETQYNNKAVTSWPQVTMTLYGGRTRTYAQLHSTQWGGNPNGFKFGAANSAGYREVKNCIAFDHVSNPHQQDAKGFDQNNCSATFDMTNALSFNNYHNYWMDKMTPKSITGTVIGFGGTVADNPSTGMTIVTPEQSEQEALAAKVYKYRDDLYDIVYSDRIAGERLCDVF